MRFLSLLLACILLIYCKKPSTNTLDLGLDYYPIAIDYWLEYDVDSISFSDFTDPITIDTATYKIREIIESSYQDLNNEENFRVESYKRIADSMNWIIEDVFSLKQSSINTQKVENDLRFIKLVFPIKKSKTWNGNIYLDVIDEPSLGFYNPNKFEWEYTYSETNQSLDIGKFTFENCVTVIQIDEENLFEKKYSKEIYAKGIGLVYKELAILETQAPPSEATFLERTENGFILKYTISDYKK